MCVIPAATSSFLGRVEELTRLRALVSAARNGVGGALLVLGDPGIGKTTLLAEATASDAVGVRVITLTGYDVESGLAYAALQRLGRPLGEHLDELAPRHRAALLVASGLEEGTPPERALVGLAALSLIARAGDDVPIVAVIDDAQHLDAESLEVLGFVARRLAAEAVALVFASREDETVAVALAGVPAIRLEGLDAGDAAQLVKRSVGELDPAVVAEIVAQTGGNPLALAELSSETDLHRLTTAALAGAPALIGKRLEAHYTSRVGTLARDAQLWLLTAAAESTGDAAIVRSAAAALGLDSTASSEVERAGLIEIHDRVRFRHPMVRSAVYNAAADVDRRAVHGALRDATSARARRDVSVWHAAAATTGTDAGVAAELVALADEARARGGLLSRARLLTRAADLTQDATARDELVVAAAEAAIESGAARLALELLSAIDVDAVDIVVRGRSLFVRAVCAMFLADPVDLRRGTATMLAAADALHGRVPQLEQRALLQGLNFAQSTEHYTDGVSLTLLGERFRAGAEVAGGPLSVMLDALSAFILEPYEVAVPGLEAALAILDGLDDATLLEFSFVTVAPAMGLWDADTAVRLLRRAAHVARDAGALRELDAVLWVLSAVELVRCNPRQAGEYLEQARDLRRAVGYGAELVVNAAHMAWIGAPTEAVERLSAALDAAGWAGVTRMAQAALAVGEIADGDYPKARARLAVLIGRPFLQASLHQIPEFVEAAVRSGDRDAAAAAAGQVARYAEASGRPWIRGMHERAQALLCDADGDGEAAETHYLASVACLDETEMIGEQARARLLYGEWLRRARRRREAREQLHAALKTFDAVGAVRFAARARRELEASGEIANSPEREHAILTRQESIVARLAADGATNAEIAAAMLISPNTVDYHLRKIYRKLGVTSRRQLADAARAAWNA